MVYVRSVCVAPLIHIIGNNRREEIKSDIEQFYGILGNLTKVRMNESRK